MFPGQTLGTVLAVEAQHAGAIQGDDQVTLEAERGPGPHPDQAVGAALAQAGEGLAPLGMFQEMVRGVGDRQAGLVGGGQAVEIVQEAALRVTQGKVDLAATAQAQGEDPQRQPEQGTAVILDEGLETGVGHLVQPGVELGEEVAQRADEGRAQLQDLPARRRWWGVWVWTRARLSWETSARRRLSRRYSSCPCWTWGSRARGT